MRKSVKPSGVPPEVEARAARLRNEITRYDRLYYQEDRPELSDFEYDRLQRELLDLEQAYPVLRVHDTPTRKVGGVPLPGFKPVRHARPMLSLANTYSRDEVRDFCARAARLMPDAGFSFLVEPKIDGVAVSVRYEQGALAMAASRGNGRVGDDITANIRVIGGIPAHLKVDRPPAVFEARGEVYMPRAGFKAFNRARLASGEPLMANPRNAASGSLKLLDSRQVAERPLAAVFYGCGELQGVEFLEHVELLRYLNKAGLPIPPRQWLSADADELMLALDELASARLQFPFETDGAVIKINQRGLYERMGATAKSPRWAVAFKFAPDRASTRLRDIVVQVGRTGVLTPVAELDPVELSGSVVERATLHNADEIARRDIRIGDIVSVEKAGDVIPAVVDVDKSARTGAEHIFAMPGKCPVCGGVTMRKPDETAWRCENLQCPAQVKRWIMHFAARDAMDIENLGEALIDQLVERGLVSDPADLFSLEAPRLLELDRMGKKSVDNLLAAIGMAKNRPLCNLIFGLGIRHVGIGVARILESHYGGLDELARAGVDDLTNIRDIGPAVARSIVDYFAASRTVDLIDRLRAAGVNMTRLSDVRVADRRFAGRSFVLTGTLDVMPRTQAETEIRRRGGRVSAGVSGKTDYVVAGNNPGSKLDKAAKLGVMVLSEAELMAMLSDGVLGKGLASPSDSIVGAPTLRRPGELPL